MRTRTNSIVTALVLLSLVSGAVGCKSNGSGPWYNPTTYSFYNPFNSKEAEAEGAAQAANAKPSVNAQPNVSTPPGGYGSKEDEARFFAAEQQKRQNSPVLKTQYEASLQDQNRVATSAMNPASTPAPNGAVPAGYAPADPYGAYAGNPSNFQHTSIKETYPQPVNPNDMVSPYSAPAYTTPVPAYTAPDYTNPGYGANSVPANAPNNYSPFGGTPVADPAAVNYGGVGPVAAPTGYPAAPAGYPATAPAVGYGVPAQPAAPPVGYVGPAAPSYGAGYTAAPSTYQ